MNNLLRGLALIAAMAASVGAMAAQRYDREDGYGAQRFRCESDGKRQRYCRIDTRGGVELSRQLSSTPCIRGRNWDYDRHGVWVSHGCRAEFAAGYDQGSAYAGGNYGTIRCESSSNRTHQCNVNGRGEVRLVRQLSSSACIEGRSWDYSPNRVWVSDGCRAEFQVSDRGNGWGGGYADDDYADNDTSWDGYGSTLRCESDDNRQRRCNTDIRDRAELVRQLSSTRCVQGSNWDWDPDGVWVDRGCRAEFVVR